MIRIETYVEKYIDKFTALFNQWEVPKTYTKEELFKAIEDTIKIANNKVILAIDENDEVLGYALYGECYHIGFEPFIEILQIIVDTKRRSEGIGTVLVKYIEEEAKKNKISRVKLSSQVQRERAHKFYSKSGYEIFKQSYFFEKKISE